jgi:hypothetical protein
MCMCLCVCVCVNMPNDISLHIYVCIYMQVKHYEIMFGVKLRVQQVDGSGEWTEHVLMPPDSITVT